MKSAWQTVIYDPVLFGASFGGTWTVQPTGLTGFSYKLIDDDAMILQWSIEATSVDGQPFELYLGIPAQREAITEQSNTFTYYDNAPALLCTGIATVTMPYPGTQKYVQLRKEGAFPNVWTNSIGGTYVFGQIMLRLKSTG